MATKKGCLIKFIVFLLKELKTISQKYEFKRLEFEPTRNYSVYIERSHQNTLKRNINHLFEYFKKELKKRIVNFILVNLMVKSLRVHHLILAILNLCMLI